MNTAWAWHNIATEYINYIIIIVVDVDDDDNKK